MRMHCRCSLQHGISLLTGWSSLPQILQTYLRIDGVLLSVANSSHKALCA